MNYRKILYSNWSERIKKRIKAEHEKCKNAWEGMKKELPEKPKDYCLNCSTIVYSTTKCKCNN